MFKCLKRPIISSEPVADQFYSESRSVTVKRPVSGSLAWAFFSIIALSVLSSTVALLTLIFGSKNGGGYTHVEWMLDNLLSGGLLLGAFFMATDYSTSPVTAPGRIIYGVGCGALTVLIRVFGGFPEGVSFAILIMNCCAWMFDKHTQRRQFGVSREDVKAKKAAAKAAKKEAKEAAANG